MKKVLLSVVLILGVTFATFAEEITIKYVGIMKGTELIQKPADPSSFFELDDGALNAAFLLDDGTTGEIFIKLLTSEVSSVDGQKWFSGAGMIGDVTSLFIDVNFSEDIKQVLILNTESKEAVILYY